MSLVIRALSLSATLGFLYLAANSVRTWRRDRTSSSGYLALALAPIAVAFAIRQIEFARPSVTATLLPVSVIALQVSGYALLLFRGTLVPLHRAARMAALVALAGSGLFLAVVGMPDIGTAPTSAQYAGAILLIVAWAACVAEPTVRLWTVAGWMPVVQRARLRALSAGYASIALILIVAVGPREATTSAAAQLGFAMAALALVPLLAIAFAPPAWVRRRWRRQEEASLGRGLQALLNEHSDRLALAERGLAWALRLTGADAGLIVDGDRTVLASRRLDGTRLEDVLADLRTGTGPGGKRERARRMRCRGIVAPLPASGAPGALVVLAGPFTPLFGAEEVALLDRYAVSLAIALERIHLLDALRAGEERARLLVEGVEDYAFFTATSTGEVASWNAGAERLVGLPIERVLGQPIATVLSVDDPEAFEAAIDVAAVSGRSQTRALRIGAVPRRLRADVIISRLAAGGREADGLAVMLHDVSEREHAERLRTMQFEVSRIVADACSLEVASPRLLESIGTALRSDVGLLWLVDPDQGRIRVHGVWWARPEHAAYAQSLVGSVRRPGESPIGEVWQSGRPQALADLTTPSGLIAHADAVNAGMRCGVGFPIMAADQALGALAFLDSTSRSLDERLLATLADVGGQIGQFVERRRAEVALAHFASTDSLTGLANRAEFEKALAVAASDAFAILAIDVDELKPLNDTYGHEAGDQALRAIGKALRMSVRDTDIVARTGGDEFTVLLPRADAGEATALAERLRTTMHGVSLAHGEAQISVGCAAGLAGDDPVRTWADADEALYRAKRAGGDRCETATAADPSCPGVLRAEWDGILSRILVEHALFAVYQPVVELQTGTILGFEALARPTPQQAGLGVDGLFAAAERLGEGRNLDWLCRRAAVADAGGLPPRTLLFINVSVSALLDPVHGVDQMLLLMNWAGCRPDRVVLEITEREAVRDTARLATVLADYRAHGFRFALDDVGAGHSTFEVLAAAVPEFVKISERLTQRADQTGPRSVIRAVVRFADDSGGHVVAEGLESDALVRLLQDLGVTHGQGYALGHPAPAAHWRGTGGRAQALELRLAFG